RSHDGLRRAIDLPGSQRVQDIDCPADVEAPAQPAGHRRARVDVDAAPVVLRSKRLDRIGRHRSGRRDVGQQEAIRPPETEHSIQISFYLVALFVDTPRNVLYTE